MKNNLFGIVILIVLGLPFSNPTYAHPGWGIEHDSEGNLISLGFSSLIQGVYMLVVKNDHLNFVTKIIKTNQLLR